jgi:hypothetical protein
LLPRNLLLFSGSVRPGVRSAHAAGFCKTRHDILAAPEHENAPVMKAFPHPSPSINDKQGSFNYLYEQVL